MQKSLHCGCHADVLAIPYAALRCAEVVVVVVQVLASLPWDLQQPHPAGAAASDLILYWDGCARR
jgi:hypothetical protein